ncbi:HpaII family restriction endonuclease [Robiginitomaculum antarcticum]|uniref:HpaII family restriction endonuclease n=1 Tax=Robiginitomaculum antarcticum TaxID=437507 RepID=UPI000376629B|nr:HpaII family restriction endonuclease [Robiginitomaculum antarcticum]
MITGNVGEWAELYAFFKILDARKLPSADKNLQIEEGRFFEFLRLYFSDPVNGALVYKSEGINVIVLNAEDNVLAELPRAKISSKLSGIFESILSGKGRSFSIPDAEVLMNSLLRTSLKAPSSEKADIFATILDRNTNTAELSGFSVKSMLKNKATLLNHSGHTLFRYELVGISPDQAKQVSEINESNSVSKYMDRVSAILELGGEFNFVSMSSVQFEKTLRKIDTMLPEFLAEMLVGFFSKQGNRLNELVEHLSASKFLKAKFNFELNRDDYEFKLKQLLVASALGMQPSRPWNGESKANGGYLIVVKTGEVLCYHAFNRDVFLNYLFQNTKFDSPGARQAPYLEIIFENGKIYTDLKLQIRFA